MHDGIKALAQLASGMTHARLFLQKKRRDRSGEHAININRATDRVYESTQLIPSSSTIWPSLPTNRIKPFISPFMESSDRSSNSSKYSSFERTNSLYLYDTFKNCYKRNLCILYVKCLCNFYFICKDLSTFIITIIYGSINDS